MQPMEALQSLAFLFVVIAAAFLAAKLILDAEQRYLARTSAPSQESTPALMEIPTTEDVPAPQLRLVWSAPARSNDVPYDQMKDLAL